MLSILIVFLLLLTCVITGQPIAIGLGLSWLIFAIKARRQSKWSDIFLATWAGLKTSWVVVRTLIMIGALIGVWMASGTIATIVNDTFSLATPKTFLLMAFIICALVSSLIGTSFGTLSVVGVPLIIVARSGQINLDLVAGAIIAGIYVGDRCSPLSSSASLVAAVTNTPLSNNLKTMFKTGILPFIFASTSYAWLSWRHPISSLSTNLLTQLKTNFLIAWWQLIPAIIVLAMALLHRPLIESILVSIVSALLLGHFFQETGWFTMLKAMVSGFHPAGIQPVSGGGIISMLSAILVVTISCGLAGVLKMTNGLHQLQETLNQKKLTPRKRFLLTSLVSFATSGFGCNQSVAIILTNTLMQPSYQEKRSVIAADIENTTVVIAPLVPWNIAAFVPTSVLGVGFANYLPYALFLWLVPLCSFLWHKKYQTKIANSL